jgi:membrane-associated phospholipid phosphatase
MLASMLAIAPLLSTGAFAQSDAAECDYETDQNCPSPVSRSLGAIKAYVTAPLRWNTSEWLSFGGAVAAIGVADHFDSQVRTHFTGNSPSALTSSNTHVLQDALPAAALLLGTWGYAKLSDDSDGRRETRAMLEASVLSIGTAYVLNYATGRQGPDRTSHPNRWWSGGASFPSEHTTLAFAIGTVLAESGNDEYRWVRRALGYGAAGYTAYERLRHNAHWLSDTVAGGALGAASAQFAMNRRRDAADVQPATLALTPIYGGVMLRYVVRLP